MDISWCIFIVTGVYKSSKHDWVAPPYDQRLETATYFNQVGETIVRKASASLGTPEVGPLTLIASMVCEKFQIKWHKVIIKWLNINIYIYTHPYIYMYIYIYPMYTYIYISIHVFIYISIHVFIYIYLSPYIYITIYIYTYIYISLYLYK